MISGTFTAPGQTSGTYAVGASTRLRVALEGFVAKCIIVAELSTDGGATFGFMREFTGQDFVLGMSGCLIPACPTGIIRLRCAYLDSGSVDWVMTP